MVTVFLASCLRSCRLSTLPWVVRGISSRMVILPGRVVELKELLVMVVEVEIGWIW